MTATRLDLPRERTLRGSRVFAEIKAGGERRACGCLVLNWRRRGAEAGLRSRLGVVTSRRIGGAVVRSRARRLMREAFRLSQPHLEPPIDLVLVARASVVGKTLNAVRQDLERCLRGVGLWMDQP